MKNATLGEERPRRRFFRHTGGVITGATLASLGAHTAWARNRDEHDWRRHDEHDWRRRDGGRRSDYGELRPTPDQDGQMILALPKDFSYVSFSRTGEMFGKGLFVPSRHDGMACFDGPGRTVRLIRNHEVSSRSAPLPVPAPAAKKYDVLGTGGCMTLDFDPHRKRLVRQFVSIAGTINNCAGGWSKGNTGWFTCEENVSGVNQGYEKPHGYTFFVPAGADSTVNAVPIKALGRFVKEAAVADSRGVIYQTEDAGNNSGFYRFLPNVSDNPLAGGTLEMLAIEGQPEANLFTVQTVGARLPVRWVSIPVPDADIEGGMTCFRQGRAAGGAAFNRLEGLFRGEDGRSMYFVSTSGGGGFGQLWHYIPGDERYREQDQLVLVFQSASGKVLESPDNICLTPNGGLIFCEDDAVNDEDRGNRMIGLGPKGEPFVLADNIFSDSEFAGACFSPDGEILFVNIQGGDAPGQGMTLAIWGPWDRGPL